MRVLLIGHVIRATTSEVTWEVSLSARPPIERPPQVPGLRLAGVQEAAVAEMGLDTQPGGFPSIPVSAGRHAYPAHLVLWCHCC